MKRVYFVDRGKIEKNLHYLENQIHLFEGKKEWNTDLEKAALERLLQMMIESMLDVGNSLIDGFIMRDPGSYDDIIDILEDERVITAEMSESYKRIVPIRKILQQQYTDVNHQEIVESFQKELPFIKEFAPKVRTYLETELETVTTFLPN